LALEMFL